MKYDCTKTLDYAHEERRLCDSKIKEKLGLRTHDCKDCELNNHPCSLASGEVTQTEIDIVQKWSDEHPEKTRAEAFREIFPHMRTFYPQRICFKNLVGVDFSRIKMECAEIGCADCWKEPYNGEFEKAREEE